MGPSMPVDTPTHVDNAVPMRRRMPDERRALTHHFFVGGQDGYLIVGFYADGQPGELFIRMAKEGSTVSGLMDAFATSVSLALQYGVPLSVLIGKFSHMRFEPSGWSGNPEIGFATSLVDYIFRWLSHRFLERKSPDSAVLHSAELSQAVNATPQVADGPVCQNCGGLMTRSGSCHTCMTCGSTSGCG
jgi:ribonucleoside-diphosphate reductase alpha chain